MNNNPMSENSPNLVTLLLWRKNHLTRNRWQINWEMARQLKVDEAWNCRKPNQVSCLLSFYQEYKTHFCGWSKKNFYICLCKKGKLGTFYVYMLMIQIIQVLCIAHLLQQKWWPGPNPIYDFDLQRQRCRNLQRN
jgi:hypothetical protein